MPKFYKRKLLAIVLCLFIVVSFLFGCSPAIPPLTGESLSPDLSPPEELLPPATSTIENNQDGASTEENAEVAFEGLSVHYLDVLQGDCILICFPDKTNMLIDCGSGSATSVDNIASALKVKEITTLDYLMLTHPDSDHIGGVKDALKDIGVKKVFHPDIKEGKEGCEDYFSVMQFLKDKGAETEISVRGVCFGEEYKVAILNHAWRRYEGCYKEFNQAYPPTETQTNDLSPFVYLEYKGVRFLFTGDNSSIQEHALLNDYDSKIIKRIFGNKGIEIKLEDIDYLKVAHHGSEDSSSAEFLSRIKPKNAIISVGGNNPYGHPSTNTQARLIAANENVNILRTDVKGTISIFINSQGSAAIKTAK